MGEQVGFARIGREHESEGLGRRAPGQRHPALDPRDDGRDAVGIGLMARRGKAQRRIGRAAFLEAGDTGQNAPVDLGQDDMHGKVCRRQPAREASHAARGAVASASWKTGTPALSSGLWPPSSRAEKAVALTMAAGARAAIHSAMAPRASGALSEEAKRPSAAAPRASNARISVAMGSRSPAAR
jgi:hypothetical protein